jgi:hypothetical protein
MVYTPADPFPKARGDAILSQDWNDAVNEIVRLDSDKVNRAGDNVAGSLTVTGNVGIGTTNPQHGRLMIEHASVPLALRETGQAANAGGLWRLALDGGALRFDANTATAGDFSSAASALSMNASGNVGVGTSPQAARLSVAATNGGIVVDSAASNNPAITLRSSGAGWGSGLQLHNSTATTGRNYGLYAGSDGSLHLSDTTSGADRLIVNNSGNVGIGMASPQRALSVNAALNVDQANANNGALNPGISFGSNSGEGVASKRTAGGNQAGLDLYTDNAARLSITNGGNVGIGTLTPRTRLEVRGSLTLEEGTSPVLFTGTGTSELNRYLLLANSPDSTSASGLKVGGVLVSDDYQYASPPKNNLIVKGSVGIGTAGPTAKLSLGGGIGIKQKLYDTNSTSDAGFGTDLSGTGYALGVFIPYGPTGADGRFEITKPANPSYSSFTNLVTVLGSGNVGIGTTAPGARLDISGSGGAAQCCAPDAHPPTLSLAEASSTANRQAWLQLHNGGEAEAYIRLAGAGPSGSGRGGQQRLEIGANRGGTAGLTVSGNVGIGMVAPDRPLTIQGSELISLRNASGTLKWHINDRGGTGDLNFAESGVADGRLYLRAGGSVGIGTTNPQYGRLMIEDASVPLSLRETGQAPNAGGLWRLVLDGGTIRFDANAAAAGDFTSYSTPLTMTPAGNVGIGTPPENAESWNRVLDVLGGPHAKLSVRTSSIDARLMAHNSGVYGAPAGAVIGTSTAHPLSFVTGATSRMLIDTSGRVGIGMPQGTSSVPYKFDVRAEGAGGQQAGRFMSQTDTANAEARGLEVTTSGAGTGWKRPLTLTASGPGHKWGQWITLTNSGDNNYQSVGTYSSVDHHPNLQDPSVGQFSAFGMQSQVNVRRDPSNSNANIPTGSAFGLHSYVFGDGPGTKYGVYANATSSDPTAGANTGTKYGIYATASGSGNVWAGYFSGNVQVAGTLSTTGAKPFVIDHPLDPENKTLRHNAVESPEVLCLYRGKVKLGSSGRKMVRMPEYFAALTKEEEATVYLTPIGKEPSPASYEWDETNTKLTVHAAAGSEVAYLVLAARDDPAVHMFHRPVEEEKGENNFEKGTLLSPVALGEPAERGFAAMPPPEGDVEGAPFVPAPPAPSAPEVSDEPPPEDSDETGEGSGRRQTGKRSRSSQGRRSGSRKKRGED